MKLCEPMDDDDDGQAHRASGRAVRADRPGERLGAGQRAGARDGRPAVSRSRTSRVKVLSGGERRRVALCRLLLQQPDVLAAGRADQPPRRRVDRLAGTAPAAVQGYGHRRDPRPLLPRQRGGLDSRTGPRRGDSVEGQLLRLARPEDDAHGHGGEAGVEAPQDPRTRAGVGAHVAVGASRQVESPSVGLRQDDERGRQAERGEARNIHTRTVRVWATW